MALKDLPGSVVLDFKILLDQLNNYIREVAEKSAGKVPSRPRGMDYSRLKNAWLSINQGPTPQSKQQMEALYQNLKANIKVDASAVATFDSKYKDKATWANNFFIIRTKVIGVVNSNDPILKIFDDLWAKLESITGKWSWGK